MDRLANTGDYCGIIPSSAHISLNSLQDPLYRARYNVNIKLLITIIRSHL
jgi:hypothetical protein